MDHKKKKNRTAHRFVVHFAHVLDICEIFLAILILIAFAACLLSLMKDVPDMMDKGDVKSFQEFLETIFTLVVGIEFIKMLIQHTPSSVLEVVMFALARQMVAFETNVWQNLITVVSIGIIFVIRRFVYIDSFESEDDVPITNWMEFSEEDEETLKK